jgi:hypothetical protein
VLIEDPDTRERLRCRVETTTTEELAGILLSLGRTVWDEVLGILGRTMGVREITLVVVIWGIVPAIILSALFFSIIIVRRTLQDERGTSARAGFWAGILLMIIFVISQWNTVKSPAFSLKFLPSLNLESAGIGLIIGFLFLWIVRFLLPTQMVGLISLILSAASTSGLYAYVFIESLRGTILFLALGIAFGALLHIVLFPNSIRVERPSDSQEKSHGWGSGVKQQTSNSEIK